jgi:mono/diheme cytochrome c family protein
MNTYVLRFGMLASLIALHAVAHADVTAGKTLHDGYCIGCHMNMRGGDGSSMYTRPDHRVRNLDGLTQQVTRCTKNLSITLKEKQIQDVVDYLNSTYYKFKTK